MLPKSVPSPLKSFPNLKSLKKLISKACWLLLKRVIKRPILLLNMASVLGNISFWKPNPSPLKWLFVFGLKISLDSMLETAEPSKLSFLPMPIRVKKS